MDAIARAASSTKNPDPASVRSAERASARYHAPYGARASGHVERAERSALRAPLRRRRHDAHAGADRDDANRAPEPPARRDRRALRLEREIDLTRRPPIRSAPPPRTSPARRATWRRSSSSARRRIRRATSGRSASCSTACSPDAFPTTRRRWPVRCSRSSDGCAPLDEVAPRVPSELAKVVARALGRTLEERFASAGELAAALAPFAGRAEATRSPERASPPRQPASTPPREAAPPTPTPTPTPGRRIRALVALVALIALVVVLVSQRAIAPTPPAPTAAAEKPPSAGASLATAATAASPLASPSTAASALPSPSTTTARPNAPAPPPARSALRDASSPAPSARPATSDDGFPTHL